MNSTDTKWDMDTLAKMFRPEIDAGVLCTDDEAHVSLMVARADAQVVNEDRARAIAREEVEAFMQRQVDNGHNMMVSAGYTPAGGG